MDLRDQKLDERILTIEERSPAARRAAKASGGASKNSASRAPLPRKTKDNL